MPAPSKPMKQSKPARVNPSQSGRPDTPPDSPTAQLSNPLEFARQVIDMVKLIQTSEPKDAAPIVEPQAELHVQVSEPVVRASKLEVKEVHEVWDSKAYQYKIVESPPTSELSSLDAYIFVARTHIDSTSKKSTVYIDIKSEALRDILRIVLKDIKWLSLGEDKPTVEQNLLFHYLPELEAYRVDQGQGLTPGGKSVNALDLLIRTIKDRYASIIDRLNPLLKEGKITYDLLWAFFKANTHIISMCAGSGKLRCLRYDMGEEKKTDQGLEYFEMQCRYIDFDGKLFGTVLAKLPIEKFRGARQIHSLNAFPLRFHPTYETIRESITSRGRKFAELSGSHHQSYQGHAFFQHKDDLIRKTVSSRIMIDAQQFRKSIPSYPRFFTKKSELEVNLATLFVSSTESSSPRLKTNGFVLGEMREDDLLICSPTVMGFSLADKFWGEYAVEDIRPIEWSDLPFAALTIPAPKKEVILAITRNRLGQPTPRGQIGHCTPTFDDVIQGKGRGIILLLHGPPGVGKTFTAEALSEHFHRPLYSISAGELSIDAAELEGQLDRIFQTAKAWGAPLLLDEADVFLQERSRLTLERNRLVAVFLRKVEFFEGVLFLTTNMLNDFDAAILNRIHLKLKYDNLDKSARKVMIAQFLDLINEDVDISADFLERFASVNLNGRQIRNTISMAIDLANGKEERPSSRHISQALMTNDYMVPELSDLPVDDDLYE